jgi:hypothetical protein
VGEGIRALRRVREQYADDLRPWAVEERLRDDHLADLAAKDAMKAREQLDVWEDETRAALALPPRMALP